MNDQSQEKDEMTKKHATTTADPTDLDPAADEAPSAATAPSAVDAALRSSTEIREQIADLDDQTGKVDAEIAELTQQMDALVLRAHVFHDATAQAAIDDLKRQVYLADHRPQIALAKALLEQELQEAKDREHDERIVAMYGELDKIRELEDAAVEELREALPVFAVKVRRVAGRLAQRALHQRELTRLETGQYDSGSTWEHESNVLRALADEVAGALQAAGLGVGKSDQDFVRGSIETRKATDAASPTATADERAN
jgi:predicted  nucleic acid-binding Zn-ribbon protein